METARSRSTDQRFYGVAEAIVSKVRNDGFVKVTYPWFNEEMESEWCRVAQFFAGPNHGAFFIPEEKSEVLVAFIHGDMRFPVVIGGLYNGVDRPPGTGTDLDTHVSHRRIQSVKGHRISFFDEGPTDAAGGIVIETGNKMKISLSTTGTIRITGTVISIEGSTVMINNRVVTPNGNPI